MFLLFFAVWVLLNGRLDWDIAVFGAAISAGLYLFCCRYMHYGLEKDLLTFKRLPRLIGVFLVLLWEIVKSCFALLPYVFGSRMPDPAVARFRADGIESDTGKVFLANCITMTPGTITGSLKNGEYLVHCLDQSMAEGLESSSFVRSIERWEARK